MASPIFDMPWDQLREYRKEMIAGTPAILEVSEFEQRRAVYIQRSPIFGFPDIVTVEFVALGPELSSLAVYSRSCYGGYDSQRTVSVSSDGSSCCRRLHTRRYRAKRDGIRGGESPRQNGWLASGFDNAM
jgi:hypothetical protein